MTQAKRRTDYPLTLKAHDVAEIMRCSKAKVYDIIRRPDFPKVTEGRRIFIPRDGFFEWYRRECQGTALSSRETEMQATSK